MIGRILIFLSVLISLSNVDALQCYSCGYLELVNGTKVKLTEEYGEVPFCNDFASGDSITVEASMVRYLKLYINKCNIRNVAVLIGMHGD